MGWRAFESIYNVLEGVGGCWRVLEGAGATTEAVRTNRVNIRTKAIELDVLFATYLPN